MRSVHCFCSLRSNRHGIARVGLLMAAVLGLVETAEASLKLAGIGVSQGAGIAAYDVSKQGKESSLRPPPIQELLPRVQQPKYFKHPAACAVAIRNLGAQSSWREALTFFDSMVCSGMADVLVCNAAIEACQECHIWEWAVWLVEYSIFEVSIAPDVGTFRSAISVCSSSGQWVWALAFLDELQCRRFLADALAFSAVIKACDEAHETQQAALLEAKLAREPQPDTALQWHKGLRRNYPPPPIAELGDWQDRKANAWKQRLVSVLFDPGSNAQEVLEVVSALRKSGNVASCKEYTILINSLGKKGLWRSALTLLADMVALTLRPDRLAYSVALGVCHTSRQWQHGMQVISDMILDRLWPDVVACHAAIRLCMLAQHWEIALCLLKSMPGFGLQPSAVTYDFVIKSTKVRKSWTVAVQLLGMMRSEQVEADAHACNSVSDVCRQSEQWGSALHMLHELLQDLCMVGLQPGLITYNYAIASCGDCGQWSHALHLLRDLEQHACLPTGATYNEVIEACPLGFAMSLYSEACSRGILMDRGSCLVLLNSSVKCEDWSSAMQMLRVMSARDMRLDVATYNALIEAGCQGGPWGQVVHSALFHPPAAC